MGSALPCLLCWQSTEVREGWCPLASALPTQFEEMRKDIQVHVQGKAEDKPVTWPRIEALQPI